MPGTGEDRGIKQRVNAKEAETIRESKQLDEVTKQRSTKRNSHKRKTSARLKSRG